MNGQLETHTHGMPSDCAKRKRKDRRRCISILSYLYIQSTGFGFMLFTLKPYYNETDRQADDER